MHPAIADLEARRDGIATAPQAEFVPGGSFRDARRPLDLAEGNLTNAKQALASERGGESCPASAARGELEFARRRTGDTAR